MDNRHWPSRFLCLHKKRVRPRTRNGNAAFGQDSFSAALHLPGAGCRLVVKAEEVQEAVDGEQGEFVFQRPAGGLGLTGGGRQGNHDVAQYFGIVLGE